MNDNASLPMRTLAVDDPDTFDVFEALIKSRNIIAVTGAGISCSSGIPVSFPISVQISLIYLYSRTSVRKTVYTLRGVDLKKISSMHRLFVTRKYLNKH
jgi:hypothetical protein